MNGFFLLPRAAVGGASLPYAGLNTLGVALRSASVSVGGGTVVLVVC